MGEGGDGGHGDIEVHVSEIEDHSQAWHDNAFVIGKFGHDKGKFADACSNYNTVCEVILAANFLGIL
jgi:hypothetical protein